jgi:hypothetical protein
MGPSPRALRGQARTRTPTATAPRPRARGSTKHRAARSERLFIPPSETGEPPSSTAVCPKRGRWRLIRLPRADQRISGSAVDGAPTEEPRPDANNARRQRPATEGNWRVPCSCLLCWNARGCPQTFQHVPRSSILCGCINKFLCRQVNAVWGRCLTACMYARGSRGVFVGLVALGLFICTPFGSECCCCESGGGVVLAAVMVLVVLAAVVAV